MDKRNKCLVYFADLVHNYASKGPHTFPVNVGYIASYARKIYKDELEIRLFKYPLDLIRAIKQNKPDILALSNYTWNLNLNNNIISWAKSLSADIVTVYGGPDYPIGCEESLRYLRQRPALDFYVMNQGERGFANIIERYLGSSSIVNMKKTPIQNCSFLYNAGSQDTVVLGDYRRIDDLNEIPSPYLTGLMDDFFSLNLIPLMETNRGCPYLCTYCAWGRASERKVLPFLLERVKEEIEYIASRVKNINLLMVGDANFGIFERDIEIAEHLRKIKYKYGYPRDLFVAWARIRIERLIKISEIVGDMVSITTAFGSFQTMDPGVAKNIRRTNLPPRHFMRAQRHLKEQSVSTSSELILGLPGETKQSHFKGLRDLFEYDASAITCYNLRMLGGTELSTDESRRKYGMRTKYRLIDGGFGKYDAILSIEHEEMVLETNTMRKEDILYFRPVHFMIQFLWNYGYYIELLAFIEKAGINPVDFITAVIDAIATSPPKVKKVFDDFMKEAYCEWFETKDELEAHYSKPENFEFISQGGFGKLNYKYTYRILLECKNDFDEYIFLIAKDVLKEKTKIGEAAKAYLEEILAYTKNAFIDLSKLFNDEMIEKTVEFKYNILKWKKDAYQKPLYEYKRPVILRFLVPDEQKRALGNLYEQFRSPDVNQTLRKIAECVKEKDLFCRVEYS